MRAIKKTIFMAVVLAFAIAGLPATSEAQFGASNTTIRNLVRNIQTRTDSLLRTVQNDRNNYRADEIRRLIMNFESATDQLDQRLDSRRANTADVQVVLDRATQVDSFFSNNRLGAASQRDWQLLRSDIDRLAGYYNLTARWDSGGSESDYNLSDAQMRQLVNRINTRTTTFSRALRMDLNRRSVADRNAADEIRGHMSEFEMALIQLRNRVNSRQSTSSDVRALLDHAVFLNNFVTDRRLSNRTENSWNTLRPDLDRLASAFNVAWNWTNQPGDSASSYDLTGTFRLNSARSDDVRRAVDNATRNLSQAERQRVYDAMLRRLEPPQMLAIDRRGNSVTIASTRAPQVNFVADGREQVENTPRGQTVRVRASLSGDTLNITRTGERANDFTVSFDPSNDGRELLVTRTIYTDRLNQPVTVRTYYDRTSDVAQLNIYDTNREDSGADEVAESFIVPNGTQIVATLNENLTTENVSEGDRFTMTVRSPGQYQGATIEGAVLNVDRGGRVTGRSELTMDFETIRLRDGRTYKFAGILESVRTPEGEVVRVDNEGAVRESNQTEKTVTRTAIGTAVGAIIGAIAGGGKGAAIGAVIGAGAGAGSVYVQGRNDLKLDAGTEVTLRATGPR